MNTSAITSEKQIKLADGRSLGYAEFGSPTGNPIFFFNGSASRLFYPMDDAMAVSANARIITVDRPGIGLSTFKPNRRLLDWPADIQELADALEFHQFAVVGASAGGPYAAACAFKLPSRVTALVLVSSLAPFDIPEISKGMTRAYKAIPIIVRIAPWVLTLAQLFMKRNPERAWTQFYARLPDCDKKILKAHPNVDVQSALIRDVQEIYRSGTQGVTWDTTVLTQPWGFSPADIKVKTFLWQGEQDRNVPLSMGRFLAAMLPNCDARFIPNAGHLVYIDRWQEIMLALTS